MRDSAFGMLRGDIRMTGFPVLDGFLEVLDAFVEVGILHTRCLGMVEGAFGMLHQGIGMALLAMGRGFFRMFNSLSHRLVIGQRQTGHDRTANERTHGHQHHQAATNRDCHSGLPKG